MPYEKAKGYLPTLSPCAPRAFNSATRTGTLVVLQVRGIIRMLDRAAVNRVGILNGK